MADHYLLKILRKGAEVWNEWILAHPDVIEPDFSGADLTGVDLSGTSLTYANFSGTNLTHAIISNAWSVYCDFTGANLSKSKLDHTDFFETNFIEADLTESFLTEAKLIGANFNRANLTKATLRRADLTEANFTGANLTMADLKGATLVETNLTGATLSQSSVHGISVWNVRLDGAKQENLVITHSEEPTITVDNLEVAQFIYLLLNNIKIREVIDTITSKVVLILGRFTDERKRVLDEIRDELRKHNYLPVLFDFEKPANRDITETVSTLAHMARFVIADITDAKSIPQELKTIVPNLPSVPVLPLILNAQHEYGMFEHFTRFPWVLPVYRYIDEVSLLRSLENQIIVPAEQKAQELAKH